MAAAQGEVRGRGPGEIIIVTAGYDAAAAARTAAASYTEALRALGWTGEISVTDSGRLRQRDVILAEGVVVIGGDQALMAEAVDRQLARSLRVAVGRRPLMTDGAATAIMGERYVTDPDPTTQAESIEEFMVDGVTTAAGLGIVEGVTLEPMLTREQRWGRLYGAAHDDPGLLSVGISEYTALQLDRQGGEVVGERSVITVDGATATWLVGSNGALGALNVWMDVLGPGDAVG